MKNILCFGDSNTFGMNPAGGRHPWHVRWPGRLQQLLGDGYHVAEDGMCGRTTVWIDPMVPHLDTGRCGARSLPIALETHRPVDMLIIMLGSNDLKMIFNAHPKMIAKGVETLCRIAATFDYKGDAAPKTLIVSPTHILDGVEHGPFISFDSGSPERSRMLSRYLAKVAEQQNCLFFDAASAARASAIDCLHLDAKAHAALADGIAGVVKSYFE